MFHYPVQLRFRRRHAHAPTSGTGGSTTYVDEVRTYDAYGRINKAQNQTTNAYTRFAYDANGKYVHSYQTVIDVTQANEFHSWQVMDGAGRVRATASDHPGSTGGYTGNYSLVSGSRQSGAQGD